jgi:hypothetical protein
MFSIEEHFGVVFSGNELAVFQDIGELKTFLISKARNGITKLYGEGLARVVRPWLSPEEENQVGSDQEYRCTLLSLRS